LNVLSKDFNISTADGEKSFKQQFTDGMTKRSEPVVRDCKQNYTKITFTPDYEYFKLAGLDEDHVAKIVRRLVDVAGCNPNLKIYINGERISIRSFEDYVALYAEEFVYEEAGGWAIAIAHSDSAFQQTSFVNSVETYMGGTHVEYITNQVTNSLREFFKKRQKVDVKPGDIRGHLHVFISCSINRPKFSSQTKENMISAVSDWGTSYNVSDKFIRKVTASHVIQSVLDWVEAKRIANERAELKKLAKNLDKASPKSVPKFNDASSSKRKETVLMLCEGDSAKTGIMSGRNPATMGVFPLRGKPINVYEMSPTEVIGNREFQSILTITGLKIGEPVAEAPDGDWELVTVGGKDVLVNSNDVSVEVDGVVYSL
jgi:DNA topoisomerase-2